MTNDKLERVARAMRKARFERTRRGAVCDPDLPLLETELLDATAAIAACEAEAGERERVLAAMIEQHIVSYRQKMNDEKNEPALRYMASGAFEALRNLRAALNTTAGEGEVG